METAQNRVLNMYTLVPIAGLSDSESKRLWLQDTK